MISYLFIDVYISSYNQYLLELYYEDEPHTNKMNLYDVIKLYDQALNTVRLSSLTLKQSTCGNTW